MPYTPWQHIDEPWARDGLPDDPMADAAEHEAERWQAIQAATMVVRHAELRPGDVYATEGGRPVVDRAASGFPPVGCYAPRRPGARNVPLTVAEVREFDHDGIRMVYVEASNGHGTSYAWPGVKARIMRRADGGQ